MGQPQIIPSFAAGELSPSLYARVDLAKFHVGAALLRNFFVDYRGGVSNRAGTKYVGRVINSFQAARLIPFQFSTVQSYALLFGDFTLKVIMNGAFVIDHTTGLDFVMTTPYAGIDLALLKVTQSADVMTICHAKYAPRNLTRTAHDAWTLSVISFVSTTPPPTNILASPSATGDNTSYVYQVTAIGANGLTESLPSAFGAGSTAANSKTMSTTLGAHITITWTLSPGATLYNIYRAPEVPGSIAVAGQSFGYVGSSTSGGFVDNNIAPDFSRTPPQAANPFNSTTTGKIIGATATQGAGYLSPPALAFAGDGAGAAGTVSLQLIGTFFYSFGGGYNVGEVLTVVGGTFTRPALVRCLSQNLAQMFDVIDGGDYSVLPGTPTTGFGSPNRTIAVALAGGSGTGAAIQAIWGLGAVTISNLGTSPYTTCAVTLSGGTAVPGGGAVAVTLGSGMNPTCSTYFQGRQVYAAPTAAPETFYMSKTGDFPNFGYAVPSRADDSITGTIASQQVNAIKHLIATNSLIALSSGGAWRIDSGQQGGAVTPSAIEAAPQAFSGCSDVPPILVNSDILYVQEKGSIVRDLSYNFYVNVYTGADMTTLANHLFYGHTIKEWAYAEEPFKIVWAVREDGVLLSFTYLKEQDVYAWAHHDTQGQFKSVCSISENGENAVYVVVQRQVSPGITGLVQFVERMQSRNMGAVPETNTPADLAKAWFVDCGLSTVLTYPNATAQPQAVVGTDTAGGTTTAVFPSIAVTGATIVAGGSGYVSPSINVLDPTGSGALLVPIVVGGAITGVTVVSIGGNYTNPTFQIVDSAGTGAVLTPQTARALTISYANNPTSTFAPLVNDMVRINRGYGRVISVGAGTMVIDVIQQLANGYTAFFSEWSCTTPVSAVAGLDHLEGQTVAILADGNVMPQQVVVGGRVTLQEPASAVVAGLPYIAQFKSLYLDIPGEPATVQGKRKSIPAVTLRVQDARGLKIGRDFVTMDEFKERDFQPMGAPIAPINGDQRVVIGSDWNVPGQLCVQQDNPLPATILALIPEIVVGDTP